MPLGVVFVLSPRDWRPPERGVAVVSSRFGVDLRTASVGPLAAILGVKGVRPIFLAAAALRCGGRGLESGILESEPTALEAVVERVVVAVSARTCCCCCLLLKPSGGERVLDVTATETGREGNRPRTWGEGVTGDLGDLAVVRRFGSRVWPETEVDEVLAEAVEE